MASSNADLPPHFSNRRESYDAICTHSTVYQSEYVIEDVEAAVSWHELEHLGEVHWPLLLIHLFVVNHCPVYIPGYAQSLDVPKVRQ